VQSHQIEISTGARVFAATKGSGDERGLGIASDQWMRVLIDVCCESDS